MMNFLLLALALTSFSFASTQNEEFLLKLKYEQKSYELKLLKEYELIKLKENNFSTSAKLQELYSFDSSCIDFVYRGPSSREEAVRACQGVTNMDCVEFVYRGASTREESARACKGDVNLECVEFVYRGPSSREESVRACHNVRDMECVEFVYRGRASREEAARSCAEDRRNPRRPDRC